MEKAKTEMFVKFVRFLVSARYKRFLKDADKQKQEKLVDKYTVAEVFRPHSKFTKLFAGMKPPAQFQAYYTAF